MRNRCVIFVRVSTKDKQSTDRQVNELNQVASSRNLKVVEVIEEKVSGTLKNDQREGIQRLLYLSRKGKYDILLVSEISRLSRNTHQLLQIVEELNSLKISIYSLNFGIETLNENGKPNPLSQFLLTILSEISRMEREQIVERIKSGLENCRKAGIKLGRRKGSTIEPKLILEKYGNIQKKLKEGYSLREINKIYGVSINTIRKVKSMMENVS